MSQQEINNLMQEGVRIWERHYEIDDILRKIAAETVKPLVEAGKFTEARQFINEFYAIAKDPESGIYRLMGRDLLSMFIMRAEGKMPNLPESVNL